MARVLSWTVTLLHTSLKNRKVQCFISDVDGRSFHHKSIKKGRGWVKKQLHRWERLARLQAVQFFLYSWKDFSLPKKRVSIIFSTVWDVSWHEWNMEHVEMNQVTYAAFNFIWRFTVAISRMRTNTYWQGTELMPILAVFKAHLEAGLLSVETVPPCIWKLSTSTPWKQIWTFREKCHLLSYSIVAPHIPRSGFRFTATHAKTNWT